jgi:hypothetical protein
VKNIKLNGSLPVTDITPYQVPNNHAANGTLALPDEAPSAHATPLPSSPCHEKRPAANR